MLKREDWRALQALLNDASSQNPQPRTDENWARLFARLAKELSA
jgi:hypothetical protein